MHYCRQNIWKDFVKPKWNIFDIDLPARKFERHHVTLKRAEEKMFTRPRPDAHAGKFIHSDITGENDISMQREWSWEWSRAIARTDCWWSNWIIDITEATLVMKVKTDDMHGKSSNNQVLRHQSYLNWKDINQQYQEWYWDKSWPYLLKSKWVEWTFACSMQFTLKI